MVFLTPFPNEFIKEFIDNSIQEQIAGFDLTVKEIMKVHNGGSLDFDNTNRKIPKHETLESKENIWKLHPGGYLVKYNEIVNVPSDAIGIVLPRSSLMRCGGTLCSAVWDPGYNGRGVGLLILFTEMEIHKNARIAQIVFIKTQEKTKKSYSGEYQNENIEG
jgi:dUTP pyrophosphatase